MIFWGDANRVHINYLCSRCNLSFQKESQSHFSADLPAEIWPLEGLLMVKISKACSKVWFSMANNSFSQSSVFSY